jgi:hypothetical protein
MRIMISKRFPQIFCFLLVTLVVAAQGAAAQSGSARKIVREAHYKVPYPIPIKVVGLQYGTKTVTFDQIFNESNAQWFNGLNIAVKNISDQPIAEVTLKLMFPSIDNPKNVMAVYFLRDSRANPIEPNAVVSLPCVMPSSKAQPEFNYTNLSLMIESVIFNDNLMWSDGSYFLWNPKTESWDVWEPSASVKKTEFKPVAYVPAAAAQLGEQTCIYRKSMTKTRVCYGDLVIGGQQLCPFQEDVLGSCGGATRCRKRYTETVYCVLSPCTLTKSKACRTGTSSDFFEIEEAW